MEFRDLIGWGGIPIVMAFVEFVKLIAPELDKRWLPVCALVFAEFWTLATAYVAQAPLDQAALVGLVVAFSAVGTYSGVRAVAGR